MKLSELRSWGHHEKGNWGTDMPGRNGLFWFFGRCGSIEILQHVLPHKPHPFDYTYIPKVDLGLDMHEINKQGTKRRENVDGSIWINVRGDGDRQVICSPYRLGVSPRMKASAPRTSQGPACRPTACPSTRHLRPRRQRWYARYVRP